MSFAAPWFLAGLAALVLPLWLHRLRTRHALRAPFSSAMLLEHSPQQQLLHKRWRYRTLLALRVLLLVAICCAFAQPSWRSAGSSRLAHGGLQLIVLDTSLSMNADGRFARARTEAEHIIDRLGGERALIVTASDGLAVSSVAGASAGAGGPSADPAALRAVLRQLHPTAARLDDGAAMSDLDSLFDQQHGPVEAHFISDFQASGTPTRFADLLPQAAPGRALTLQLQSVADGATPANWAISALHRDGDDIVVTVRGFGTPARMLGVALEINGRPAAQMTQPVSASGAAQFRFAHPLLRQGDNRIVARLMDQDALAADNVRYAVIRNTPAQPIALLTAGPGARAVRYLATALAAAGGGYQAQVQAVGGFDARTLPRYRWVMVDDLGALDAPLAAQLQTYVDNGGAVFAALGERAASLRQLPVLGDAITGSAGGGDVALTVGQLQGNHPLLAGLRGWESLSIGHMLVLAPQPSDDALVSASDGAPLLLERRIGRGRLLLYTSDLNDDWNDLPVQPLFVGLLAQLGRYLGGRGELAPVQTVGASIALGRDGGPAGQVIDPSGRTVLSLADTRRALTVKLDQAGFYQIYTPAGEALIAVNPDLRESDLAPMSAGLLARWRSALAVTRTVPTTAAAPSTNRSAVPLAPVLLGLLALLALLALAEPLLGNSYLHRRLTAGAGRS